MVKEMMLDVVRVPFGYRQNNRFYKTIRWRFPEFPNGHISNGFDFETTDDKFNFRKYKNGFNKFRVEFRVRTKIRTI